MNKNRSLFQQLFYLAINNLLCLLCLSVVADQHPADQSVDRSTDQQLTGQLTGKLTP